MDQSKLEDIKSTFKSYIRDTKLERLGIKDIKPEFRIVYQIMDKKNPIGKEYKYKKCALNWIHKEVIRRNDINFTLSVWLSEVKISEGTMSPKEYEQYCKKNNIYL